MDEIYNGIANHRYGGSGHNLPPELIAPETPEDLRPWYVEDDRSITANGYSYQMDQLGRVVDVGGRLGLNRTQGRDPGAQLAAGGPDRLGNDHGGHFIGRRFGGSEGYFNHFAQNGNFNMGAYAALEGQWARALAQGSGVRVQITPSYTGASLRPDSLIVRYQVNNGRWTTREFANRPGGR